MQEILFVCMGNICRSPMAEAIFRDAFVKERQQADFLVDSAATSSWEVGNPPHRGTQKILKQHNISTKGIVARQIKLTDFDRFDYIIAMDNENLSDLKEMAPADSKAEILLYLDILPEKQGQSIPDPWYTGDFEETYGLITAGLKPWLSFFNQA
ncbi:MULTISPECIES: low molecular weight protein-tyrosine-phosphatase [Enterococcus]|uniref:protein-tyrosine-phosphatase n=1 Tax=Enterococcus alishanensis TaxID=1303817 RepID=A0ABS6TFV7_9ENTE|nr:low molecular weight protein-tyrosine-phosphatase [Enterococcus alishanensis]MBV7391776.1 low molecular weight phosphotyrosine protein phosphatase [Enterococcus alishanensis]